MLWWSPDPRMVLIPKELHISRSLRRRVRRGGFEVRINHAFRRVIGACAGARDGDTGTWITGDIQRAYEDLHQAGHAHSVETWIDGQLAGGLYGVAIGRAFFGESMFAHQSDASKLALVFLVTQLTRWGFGVVDCQQKTLHLASLWRARDPARGLPAVPPRLHVAIRTPGLAVRRGSGDGDRREPVGKHLRLRLPTPRQSARMHQSPAQPSSERTGCANRRKPWSCDCARPSSPPQVGLMMVDSRGSDRARESRSRAPVRLLARRAAGPAGRHARPRTVPFCAVDVQARRRVGAARHGAGRSRPALASQGRVRGAG